MQIQPTSPASIAAASVANVTAQITSKLRAGTNSPAAMDFQVAGADAANADKNPDGRATRPQNDDQVEEPEAQTNETQGPPSDPSRLDIIA